MLLQGIKKSMDISRFERQLLENICRSGTNGDVNFQYASMFVT